MCRELKMLRTILVALDDSPYTEISTSLAIEWGKRFGARLFGVGVLDKPSITGPELVPLGASSFKKERDEARMADAHRRVLGFLSDFRERCSAAGITSEVLEDVGDPADSILREAHRCDVVMLGRETHFRFETQDAPDPTLAKVLRRSPRPIVVVPEELSAGNGVVVAYGGGREVARTLQTFQLLGLAAGETVHLVSVHREGWEAGSLARLACYFLEAHGAAYKLHDLESGGEPAEVLLEQVRKLRPRLLVMGAHGHHPLRDLFATSVTRAVLRACPVPVLIGA
jgi:nucleotide-binding universal stress UspA family protein